MPKQIDLLKARVAYYERMLDEMQGHVFYCENDEGVLGRWFPPKKLSFPPHKTGD